MFASVTFVKSFHNCKIVIHVMAGNLMLRSILFPLALQHWSFTFIPILLLTAGIITLNPRYGNMLGGSSILVSGPYFTVQEEDQITCLFDNTTVDGIFVNSKQVLCVSPALPRTGRVPFQLLVTGGTDFIGQSVFVSGKFRSVVVSCVYCSQGS